MQRRSQHDILGMHICAALNEQLGYPAEPFLTSHVKWGAQLALRCDIDSGIVPNKQQASFKMLVQAGKIHLGIIDTNYDNTNTNTNNLRT